MPLQVWELNRPVALRVGYAIFDTRRPTYHAMLVAAESLVHSAAGTAQVPICDMAPPLRWGDSPRARHRLSSHSYVAWLEELSGDDYDRICAAAESLRARPPSASGEPGVYWLGTHGVEFADANDDEAESPPQPAHCSCASLVEWCYETVGVDLVAAATLPQFSLEEIRLLFCPTVSPNEVADHLATWGLDGPGPWPLLLPAQQMHAFQQPLAALPYHAVPDDHPFTV